MKRTSHKNLQDELTCLGMGNMRLPQKDDKIDYEQAEAMIDYLYAEGVNYYDTAYFYHGGESEVFLNKALVSRYPRDSYYLADKLPVGMIEEEEQIQTIFDTQMERLGVDVVDYHLLHALNKNNWEKAKRLGIDRFQRDLKEKGIVRHIGFSFHDTPEVLEQILNEGEWDFVQLQINYLDWYKYDAKKLYESCEKRDLPIIVMEPIRGGSLATLHNDLETIFNEARPDASLASWALRWVNDLPLVKVILSGMSEMAHCTDNVATFRANEALTEADQAVIERVMETLEQLPTVPCTDCKYCNECPMSIDIPGLFTKYNNYLTFGQEWQLTGAYLGKTDPAVQANVCIACGVCEAACPQRIPIIQEIARIHELATNL